MVVKLAQYDIKQSKVRLRRICLWHDSATTGLAFKCQALDRTEFLPEPLQILLYLRNFTTKVSLGLFGGFTDLR